MSDDEKMDFADCTGCEHWSSEGCTIPYCIHLAWTNDEDFCREIEATSFVEAELFFAGDDE